MWVGFGYSIVVDKISKGEGGVRTCNHNLPWAYVNIN